MKTLLGIDTGGTFTDAALVEKGTYRVLASAKSPTTRDDLSKGIAGSIGGLGLTEVSGIEKVVLSTTLATNAIVEGQGRPTGLILIGQRPKGELPESHTAQIDGKINIKGKEVAPLDIAAAEAACDAIAPQVEAFAVSGMMSVRNASQELAVKEIIARRSGLPVVCGHELSSSLGFHDRTVTAVLNASLIPIINGFIQAVQRALAALHITAPIYMVKGDGSLANLDFIREKPIESILSGPAASIIGAMGLSGLHSGIIADMGGTTTDTAVIVDDTITLSAVGARVGEWQTQIDSAAISTCALGGDTLMEAQAGHPALMGRRVLPACRGGERGLTPTDLLHYTGDLVRWDRALAADRAREEAGAAGQTAEAYVAEGEGLVLDTIGEALALYADTPYPVIAIGAPAGTWYQKLARSTGQQVVVPEHYEVANAVGAAMASVEERVEALVRPDEENDGFVAHVAGECRSFAEKDAAVAFAQERAKALSIAGARRQGAEALNTQVFTDERVEHLGWRDRYIETRIKAVSKANTLRLQEADDRDVR
jgi:N-methylhydantoinase A/oxoprolinase/acetone carboxylase beta subunit